MWFTPNGPQFSDGINHFVCLAAHVSRLQSEEPIRVLAVLCGEHVTPGGPWFTSSLLPWLTSVAFWSALTGGQTWPASVFTQAMMRAARRPAPALAPGRGAVLKTWAPPGVLSGGLQAADPICSAGDGRLLINVWVIENWETVKERGRERRRGKDKEWEREWVRRSIIRWAKVNLPWRGHLPELQCPGREAEAGVSYGCDCLGSINLQSSPTGLSGTKVLYLLTRHNLSPCATPGSCIIQVNGWLGAEGIPTSSTPLFSPSVTFFCGGQNLSRQSFRKTLYKSLKMLPESKLIQTGGV